MTHQSFISTIQTINSSLPLKSSLLLKFKRGKPPKNVPHSRKTNLNSLSFGDSGEKKEELLLSEELPPLRAKGLLSALKASFHFVNLEATPSVFKAVPSLRKGKGVI